jgi:CheY-like chemotaxis protein
MKHVLYVEDSATSQLLMRKYLNSSHELTITPSPRAALELMEQRTFHLIVTDFLFPDGDAIDFITHVRRKHEPLRVPILVVSSSMDATLLNRLLKAGANDGLAKPLPTAAFRAMVERLFAEPYVRTPEKSLTSVTCFQWVQSDQFHEYCPELGLHCTGESREAVGRRMFEMLREQIGKGAKLGFATHERVVTHVVQE